MAKIPTPWQFNPAYYANQYTYNSSGLTYDSAVQTYDGVAAGQQVSSTKPKTAWVTTS